MQHTDDPLFKITTASPEAYDTGIRELLFSGTDLDDMIFYGEDWCPSER